MTEVLYSIFDVLPKIDLRLETLWISASAENEILNVKIIQQFCKEKLLYTNDRYNTNLKGQLAMIINLLNQSILQIEWGIQTPCTMLTVERFDTLV